MVMRRLGRSEIHIGPLVLGGNVFGWTVDQRTANGILDEFADAGFNALDTADVYSAWAPEHRGGESETVIGEWLKSRGGRNRFIIATKVGEKMPGIGHGLKPDHIVRSVEASLRRLQTDYIDIYQAHVDDPDTPLDVTLETFQRLSQDGKIRMIGASRYGPDRLGRALRTSDRLSLPRYESLQERYNLFDRSSFEGALQTLCVEENVGMLCYSGLAKGFLTGDYRAGRSPSPGPWTEMVEQRYCNARGFQIIDALDEVAAENKATVAATALAWVTRQPGVAAAIVSVQTIEQLREIASFPHIALEASQLRRLKEAGDEPVAHRNA